MVKLSTTTLIPSIKIISQKDNYTNGLSKLLPEDYRRGGTVMQVSLKTRWRPVRTVRPKNQNQRRR